MTKREIVQLLTRDFYENFASECAKIIIAEKAEETLFGLLCDMIGREKSVLNELGIKKGYEEGKTEFRAAYVFEYVYFANPQFLESRVVEFAMLFPAVRGESAKRHFCKIMANLLNYTDVNKYRVEFEIVASSCIDWIISRKVKVAVVVWAVECLLKLKPFYRWLPEILEEIMDNLSENPTAGMKVRLKKWKMQPL
jgi:hypothetical protein